MKIYIRVDSGRAIGTGHIMRCLTLADALSNFFKDKDPKIIFLSRPHTGNIIEFIQKKGYEVISLSQPEFSGGHDEKSWLGTSQEKDALECFPIIDKADLLIIDHYSIDMTWENLIRSHVQKIFVIDDLANRQHNCDILLDQNFYLDKDTRYNGLISEYCQIFTGPEYALLRPEFFEVAKDYNFSGEVKNILVFFGGVDSAGMTLKTINILKDYDYISHIICGTSNNDKDTIKKLCASHKNLIFYENVENMAEVMASCDVAIGAGGTTQWERACIGIPSLVFSIADNQVKACQDLYSANLIDYKLFDNVLLLKKDINSFLQDNKFRFDLFQNNKTLNASKKIDVIFNVIKMNQNYKIKTHKNVEFFLKNILSLSKEAQDSVRILRNLDDVRKYMYSEHIITIDEHQNWLKHLAKDIHKNIIFVVHDDKNIPCGIISITNITYEHKRAEWAFYVSPSVRGGIGRALEQFALNYVFTELKLNKLNCEVLIDNASVIDLHSSFGFQKEGVRKAHCYKNNQYLDIVLMGITAQEYEKHYQKAVA